MLSLNSRDPGFAVAFRALVEARRETDEDVSCDVAAILARVRHEGDAAVAELTQRFDGHSLPWRIAPEACAAAYASLEPALRAALNLAAARIRDYHERQRPADSCWTDDTGVTMGARWGVVEAAGLYVPGGRAAYPSSVLMNAIPAKVAGVGRLVMVSPTPGGTANRAVLAAAHIAGVDEIWRIGGAQAVGAMAYGTATIAPVDVIVGPGNAWVAEAKRQLYGRVGIDMVAGPSEILVVADAENDPEWIAADLLSQAEHDPTSQSILITDDAGFADAVVAAIETMLAGWATARASWDAHGGRRSRRDVRARPPRRIRVPRSSHARGDRRLSGRPQPRPAHRAARPFFLWIVSDRFYETHEFSGRKPASAGRTWPRRRNACRCGRTARTCRVDPRETQMKNRSRSRSAARLAAVQALYQHDMEATPVTQLLHEFHQHRLGATIGDDEYAEAEVDFFDDVVTGATARAGEIDAAISARLSSDWTLERLDKPMRAILRAGTYELLARADVPVKSVINEYVDVADAFYAKREKGFVNGLLDAVAKDVRG
jgi:histidinol dehydrogenase